MIRGCCLFSFAKWKTVANGKADSLKIIHTLLIAIVISTGAENIIKSETVFQSCLQTILYINIANLNGRNECYSCLNRFSQIESWVRSACCRYTSPMRSLVKSILRLPNGIVALIPVPI